MSAFDLSAVALLFKDVCVQSLQQRGDPQPSDTKQIDERLSAARDLIDKRRRLVSHYDTWADDGPPVLGKLRQALDARPFQLVDAVSWRMQGQPQRDKVIAERRTIEIVRDCRTLVRERNEPS